MKKYILSVFFIGLLIITVGCGKTNQVKCSKTETEEGEKMTAEVVANLDSNNKIKDVSMTYDFSSKSTAETFCQMFKSDDSSKKDVTCSGTKITVKNLESFENDEETSKKFNEMTKDDFVKIAKEDGFTCK